MTIDVLIVSAAMAVAAGLIGCFAVIRRMALAGDAMAHIALPGIGVALALHVHPVFGAAAMLFFGALLVWAVDDCSRVATETLIGVLFSTALAIGSMMTSGEDLIGALLGSPADLSRPELVFGLAASAAVITFVLLRRNEMILALLSPDVARTAGVNVSLLNLAYLQMFALTVALGLRYLGVLLMGSLIIIPAASAKRVSGSLNQMLTIAALTSVAATLIGATIAGRLHREAGPLIITVAAAGFLLTFAWPVRRLALWS
ncbi:MAG TPA: metal ABC transporter permease [Vicinamibacterales bacterium]|jgi:ABC-type Mn2+/Zn2+ transport system permease subunit|nr:metal ABC transporter permease [Vicinamibacterales bacterium]